MYTYIPTGNNYTTKKDTNFKICMPTSFHPPVRVPNQLLQN